LIAGDGKASVRTYLQLREQGERLTGLTYLIAKSLRDALAVSIRLQNGESTGEVKRGLRMSRVWLIATWLMCLARVPSGCGVRLARSRISRSTRVAERFSRAHARPCRR